MDSQIRGLNQAVRNASDGISMIQTAEGALDEVTNILQRIRELSIQSANGIYSDPDRSTLNAEVQQLKSELDRIASETTFNGQPLLDGSLADVDLQVGSQAYQTVTLEIGSMNVDTLGGASGGDIVGTTMTVAPDLITTITGAANNEMFINGQNVGDLTAVTITNMDELLGTINGNLSGVEASAFTEMKLTTEGTGILRGGEALEISVINTNGSTNVYEVTDTGSMEELAAKITEETGGIVTASLDDSNKLVLSNETGASIQLNEATGSTAATVEAAVGFTGTVVQQAQLSLDSTDGSGEVTISYGSAIDDGTAAAEIGFNQRIAAGDITGSPITTFATDLAEGDLIINDVAIGAILQGTNADTQGASIEAAINLLSAEHGVVATFDATTDSLELNSVSGDEVSIAFGGNAPAVGTMLTLTGLLETNSAVTQGDAVKDIDISTAEGAQEAIGIVDNALETINATRADLGAVNNRLDFTISNLMNVSEKTSAARSRIMDADFAAETSELSRAQVLQQASQAMLAQANARPQQVLQLLNG